MSSSFRALVIWLVLSLSSGGLLVACSGGGPGAESVAPIGGGEDDDDDPAVELPDDSLMFIEAVARQSLNYVTHVRGDWSRRCTIDLDDTNVMNRDIECIVEAKELDLYFNGISLAYNVPSNTKCSYLELDPYWYWRFPTGVGATSYTVDVSESGTVTRDAGSDPGGLVQIVNNEPLCIYNHTAVEGPNCCTGAYTETRRIDTGAGIEVQTTEGIWGTDVSQCIGGAANDMTDKSKVGIPRTKIMNMKKEDPSVFQAGLSLALDVGSSKLKSQFISPMAATYKTSGTFEAQSPINLNLATNVYIANMLDEVAGVPISAPPALTSADVYGHGTPEPNTSYEWRCVDDAREVYARVRLHVREWNMESEFNLEGAGNPDSSGVDPDFSNSYNDFGDWLDFDTLGLSYPGIYE